MSEDLDTLIKSLPQTIQAPSAPSIDDIKKAGLRQRRKVHLLSGLAAIATSLLVVSSIGQFPSQLGRSSTELNTDSQEGANMTTGGAPTPSPSPGWEFHVNEVKGLTIQTPSDWDVTWGYENQYLIVSSHATPNGELCGPSGALTQLPADGVYLWMFEPKNITDWSFPSRPSHFTLDPSTLGPYEGQSCVESYRITFRDSGRFFVAYMSFGSNFDKSTVSNTLAALDTLAIDPNS